MRHLRGDSCAFCSCVTTSSDSIREHLASVPGNERAENERDDGGELDENVDGRAGGVLERVSNGISDNSGRMLRVTLPDFQVVLGVDGIGHVKSSLFLGEVRVIGQLSSSFSSFL